MSYVKSKSRLFFCTDWYYRRYPVGAALYSSAFNGYRSRYAYGDPPMAGRLRRSAGGVFIAFGVTLRLFSYRPVLPVVLVQHLEQRDLRDDVAPLRVLEERRRWNV